MPSSLREISNALRNTPQPHSLALQNLTKTRKETGGIRCAETQAGD